MLPLPIPREIWRQVRAFTEEIGEQAKALAVACNSEKNRMLLRHNLWRGTLKSLKWRLRARERLRENLEALGARWAPLGDDPAGWRWVYLRPSSSIYVAAESLGRTNNCILTETIFVAGDRLLRSTHGLEVPNHTLARILQRSDSNVDLREVIFDGYFNALALDTETTLIPFMAAVERTLDMDRAPCGFFPSRCRLFPRPAGRRGAGRHARQYRPRPDPISKGRFVAAFRSNDRGARARDRARRAAWPAVARSIPQSIVDPNVMIYFLQW
jgi:hypothetical protein